MRIVPPVSVKQLDGTSPGELVRAPFGENAVLALVAQADGQRFLIFLENLDERNRMPCFLAPEGDWGSIISYGKDYEFVIDPSKQFTDLRAKKYWDFSGSIMISGELTLMCVAPVQGSKIRGNAYYDLKTGQLVGKPSGRVPVLLGQWDIRLISDRSPQISPPLASFSMPQ